MKENFQIHIWLGLLLCLLGMSCSDDTPAKGDDPGNGNTELEVNEWQERLPISVFSYRRRALRDERTLARAVLRQSQPHRPGIRVW